MTWKTTALALTLLISAGAAAAQDWSGSYGGLSLTNLRGDWQHRNASGVVYNDGAYSNDAGLGLFAGYNFQSGQFVYGAEVAVAQPGGFCFEEYPNECTDRLVDLKARLGFAAGSALVYGVAGMTRADYDLGGTQVLTGTAYGLGLDFRLSEKYFVGGEVLRRELDYADQDYKTEHSINSVSLRFGMSF